MQQPRAHPSSSTPAEQESSIPGQVITLLILLKAHLISDQCHTAQGTSPPAPHEASAERRGFCMDEDTGREKITTLTLQKAVLTRSWTVQTTKVCLKRFRLNKPLCRKSPLQGQVKPRAQQCHLPRFWSPCVPAPVQHLHRVSKAEENSNSRRKFSPFRLF